MSPVATPRWKVALVAAAAAGAATLAVVATSTLGNQAGATVPPSTTPETDEGDAGSTSERTIAVTGHGTVKVVPDIAQIWLGVQTDRPTASEAMDVIAAKSADLVTTLKALDVTAADIQTSGISLYPKYDNEGVAVDGYQGSVSVTVTLRDIDRIGLVLDGVQGFVGEELTISGISFSYDDPEAVLGDARAAAVANARERAAQYADAAGTEVGEVIRIAETSTGGMEPMYYEERAAADMAGGMAIEPGSQELAVDVTVVFEMT